MKQFLLILITLPILLLGCAKDVSIQNEQDGDGTINFAPNSYTADVTQYEWADNDAVGVFMLPKNVSVANGGDADKRNKKYLYSDTSEKFKADGAANQLNFNGIDWVKFVAYRPFVDNIDNATKDYVYPINVGDQTTEYRDIDFIYSNTGRLYSKIGGAIELEYKHMLSKLVLKFTSATPATLTSLDAIYVKNMATTVNFDMKDETFKGWDNYAGSSIRAVSEITQVSDVGARLFEVIVTPTPAGGWSLSDRLIEYKTSIVAEKSLAVSDEYESGMMYLYNIDLDEVKNEVEIEYVEVIEWGDGEAFGLDADITAFFRDPVFRQFVKVNYCGNRDKILKSDLVAITSVSINPSGLILPRTISTLAGIEYFPKLTSLNVYNVSLKSLNVSRNLALKSLTCNNNPLTRLDVSRNLALTTLSCNFNALTSLDVSRNVALTTLGCVGNQLTSLDVSGAVVLTTLQCYSNQLTSLDVSRNVALTNLECQTNPLLPSLDVSGAVALKTLKCFSNPLLTSLDVSRNTALEVLWCYSNRLTRLDVSTNTALTNLVCHSNLLTSLDVSTNTALSVLSCHNNPLTSLDISRNVALTQLICNNSQLTSIDVSNCSKLTLLHCFSNQLTSLNVSKNLALTQLHSYSNPLTSLDVSKNTKLTVLHCNFSQLTSLDVSKNTALTQLWCYSNRLTSLDVSKNLALSSLYCYNNRLTSLDLSAHTILTKFTAIRFDINPGNGTEAGSPNGTNPADFEVKLPSGATPPKGFPSSTSPGKIFIWDYQFSNDAGGLVGVEFKVNTLYTNL